jgi:uncharacterized membrane protein (DUF4010 family)
MNPAGILLGALCGATIGVERQWSGHAGSHFAGIRTFTLLGGLAGIAGWLWTGGLEVLAALLLAGAVALVAIAYAAVSRRDADATTEVAALIVIGAGLLSGLGWWRLASGIVIVTAVLLVEKSRLHRMVEHIPGAGLRAGFRFALMAVVILPLLPEGPYGPLGGIRPRELWLLVLFFSGISFAAYVVRSLMAPGRGYVLAGALGGLISSTNVTLTFSRLSRSDRAAGGALALGTVAACTMLYLRVLGASAVLSPALARAVLPYAAAPLAIGAVLLWSGLRATPPGEDSAPEERSPLQFRSALQMAALFQAVLFLITAVREAWGATGLVVSGAVLGLTDVDALVISMAHTARDPAQLSAAALATVAGILSNTVLKLGVAAAIGQDRFRSLTVAGLLLLGIATALPLAILR